MNGRFKCMCIFTDKKLEGVHVYIHKHSRLEDRGSQYGNKFYWGPESSNIGSLEMCISVNNIYVV